MISLVITLVVAGVLMFLLNKYGGQFIDGTILRIINIVVVICVVVWLLVQFGLIGRAHDVPVPQLR